MSKEISAPERKKFRVKKTAAKTAAAIFLISGPPIGYAGVDYSYDLMHERKTQLQEQGITQPTPDEYHDAEKIDLRCQKKAQDEVFIAKEQTRCDQAEKTIVAFDAHNEGVEEMIIMLGSLTWAVGAVIVGGSSFISKEQTTLPQKRTVPEGDPPETIPSQPTTQEIVDAQTVNRVDLNKGPVIQSRKR